MMADETQNMNDVTDEHEVAPQVKPLFPLPDLRAVTMSAYVATMKEFAVKMNAVVKKNVAVTTANPVIPD